jgi:hypothetical protein
MLRFLSIAARLAAAAGVIVAEWLWTALLLAQKIVHEPYMTITIIANATAAVALAALLLLVNRENFNSIARAVVWSGGGAIAGSCIGGSGCAGLLTADSRLSSAGEGELAILAGIIVGAVSGLCAAWWWKAVKSRRR